MEKTEKNTNAGEVKTPETQLEKPVVKKRGQNIVKVKPTSDAWKGHNLVDHLPVRFNWRNKTYVTANLTEIELKALAEDRAFRAIPDPNPAPKKK